ncbi:MAG: hypothetical protein ABL921_31215 [Pirellula sp.]
MLEKSLAAGETDPEAVLTAQDQLFQAELQLVTTKEERLTIYQKRFERMLAYEKLVKQILCYSKMIYIEFTLSQRKSEFYRCIVHALEFFRGSPKKIIFDNLKAAVLSGSGRNAVLHPEFAALCGSYYLEPIACEARDPESTALGSAKGGCIARFLSELSEAKARCCSSLMKLTCLAEMRWWICACWIVRQSRQVRR